MHQPSSSPHAPVLPGADAPVAALPTAPTATVGRLSRRSLLLGAAALAPIVAVGAGSAGQQASALSGFHDAAGLRRVGEWPHPDIRSVDFRFDTGGMVKTFPPSVRVTVPPSYGSSPDRRYPVLVLLHGQGGFYQDWTNLGGVVEQTEQHEVIVVMPDGGSGSFYSNANAPLPGREAAWESFIMDQVLPFVHANFRTRPEAMAIGGLSRGGWGALALGQRYWGHFRSVSSYSGPADCGISTADGLAVAGAIWICPSFELAKHPLTANFVGATWGPSVNPPIAKSYNPMDNIETYRGKRVFLRTGDGAWDDFFDDLRADRELLGQFEAKVGTIGENVIENAVHPNQQRFSDALGAAGIDHDFAVIRGATHEWGLWKDNLAEDLPGIMGVLNA